MLLRASLVGVLMVLVVAGVATLPRIANNLARPLATVAHWPERVRAQWFPRRVRRRAQLAGLTDPEQAAVRELSRRLDGLIVWASNRTGQHQLYVVDLRTQAARQLTHAPQVSFFARFSPDGRQIVFLRSQPEHLSVRDFDHWNVYLINVDGTGERPIALGGLHPMWTADGTGIVFHRGTRVFRYDVARGQEAMLFDAATELPGIDADLGDVELSPEGRRLAFVLRGRFSGAHGLRGAFSGAAVFELNPRRLVLLTTEQACQTTWAPDGQQVVWMETGGIGGTRVMTGRPDGTARHVFMDLPGAYSHEYFPKLSNDGRWLIWGAAAEGHEQDQANYEIFLWEVGTPWETVIRLTDHPDNSSWPDLWVRA